MDNSDQITIYSWNSRSIYNKLSELKLLLYTKKPHVICLQEIWSREGVTPNFINYRLLSKQRQFNRGGGVAFLVRSDLIILNDKIDMYPNGKLECQLIKIKTHFNCMDIINLYNPIERVTQVEFEYYFKQLGRNAVALGDFNSHHTVWDTRRPNCSNGINLLAATAKYQLQLITPQNLVTYIDNRTGRPSTLDLCFMSAALFPSSNLMLAADMGSDHCPIKISVQIRPALNPIKIRNKWVIDNNKWEEYKHNLPILQEDLDTNDQEEVYNILKENINKAAKETFKESGTVLNIKYSKDWWNIECSRAVAARRRARNKMKRYPTRFNIKNFQEISRETRRIIDENKKKSFRNFCDTLTATTPLSVVWKKIRKFKNRTISNNNEPLINNNQIIHTSLDKAQCFLTYFTNVFTNNNPAISVQDRYVIDQAKNDMTDEYNGNFTYTELETTLRNLRNTAPGHDNILNLFLKNLPDSYRMFILKLTNMSWNTGKLFND